MTMYGLVPAQINSYMFALEINFYFECVFRRYINSPILLLACKVHLRSFVLAVLFEWVVEMFITKYKGGEFW